MKTKIINQIRRLAIAAGITSLFMATSAKAGTIIKSASGTDLTQGASWSGSVAPGTSDIAAWNSSSLGVGLALGSAASWDGMSVSGALSDMDISGAGPLTLGAGGVDMSTSTVNLSLGVPVALGTDQIWNVNAGESLNMSGVISGNFGLTIAGAGLLILTNANTFSGGTTVNGGTLALDYNVNDQPTGTLAGGSPVTVNIGGTLRCDIEDALGWNVWWLAGAPSQLNINGGVVTTADVANSTPVNDPNISGGTSFRVTLPTVNFQGGTLSSGANQQGDHYGGCYLMNGVNTYSNSATAVINAYSVSFNNGDGTFTVAAGNTPSGVDLEVSSLLGGWFGGFSLTKAGAGVMELDQNSTPSAVNVNAGTLFLNGTFGTCPITVAANAKFLASGSLNGPITVASGGTFGVGRTNINILSSYSTVTFNSGSTNYMKISKNGNSAQSDQVQNLSSVTFAGTLVVSDITSDATPLASGDTFTFFPSASAFHANFTSVVLPALPVGLGWDISQLASGIITVSSSAAPPIFSPAPGGYAGALTVTISSLTPGATIYYTTDGSTPTTSSPSGITPVTVLLPANTNITIQAFALESGYSASSVQSAAYSTYTSYTWVDPAGGNWSSTANWSNNAVANGVGTPADFSELTLSGDTTAYLDIPTTVGALTFGDQGDAYNWILADGGGGPLTLNNGTNAPVILVSNQTTTVSAVLAGSSGFVKTGSGTLLLDNAVANTGSLVVSNGTVALGYNPNDQQPGTLAAGTTNTVNSGGTLLMNIEDAMGWGSGSTALLNINGGLVTSADVTSGSSFRVTLPTLNFTGGTLSSGTNNHGDSYGGSYLVNNVNTLASSNTVTINAYSVSLNNNTFTVASGATPSGVDLNVASIMEDIFGSKGFTKAGPGVMELSGANTYSGATTISAGTLQLVANAGNTSSGVSSALNVPSYGSFSLAPGTTLQLRSDGDVSFGGGNNMGGLGNGTVTFDVNQVNAGNNNHALSFAPTGFNTYNEVLNVTGGNGYSLSFGPIIGDSSSLTLNPTTANLTVNALSSVSALTKNGAGTLTINGASTYAGNTSLNAGTLELANVNALGANGNTLYLNATASAAKLSIDVGFGGANLYDVTLNQIGPYVGTMILNRATAGASTPITHNFGALTLSLNWGAPTGLNVLAGPNAPTGGAVDTLAFSSVNFGNWYSVTETIAPTNVNVVIGSGSAEASSAYASTQVATLDLDGTSTGNQITGAIVDNGSGSTYNAAAILKSNSGKWTLSGANSYTGNTTISGGTLALAGSGSIANTPNITIAGGATLDVSALSSPFVLGSSQTLGNSSSTAVFNGNGSAVTGTLTLNYTNGLPALTVSNGTLTLSSSTVFQINNLGSQLPGGTYTLISKSGGGAVAGTVPTGAITVGGGGAASTATLTITNGQLNLVVASSVNTNPTNITVTVSGGNLNLSWPADHLGWTLQTNSVGLAAGNQWFPYPGSATVINLSIPIDHTKSSVFFRMTYP